MRLTSYKLSFSFQKMKKSITYLQSVIALIIGTNLGYKFHQNMHEK